MHWARVCIVRVKPYRPGLRATARRRTAWPSRSESPLHWAAGSGPARRVRRSGPLHEEEDCAAGPAASLSRDSPRARLEGSVPGSNSGAVRAPAPTRTPEPTSPSAPRRIGHLLARQPVRPFPCYGAESVGVLEIVAPQSMQSNSPFTPGPTRPPLRAAYRLRQLACWLSNRPPGRAGPVAVSLRSETQQALDPGS